MGRDAWQPRRWHRQDRRQLGLDAAERAILQAMLTMLAMVTVLMLARVAETVERARESVLNTVTAVTAVSGLCRRGGVPGMSGGSIGISISIGIRMAQLGHDRKRRR